MNYMPYVMLGNKILDSVIGKGIKSLGSDLISAIQILGSIIIIVMFLFVSVKKAKESEEEQERKRYSKVQISLVILIVIVWLAIPLINLILSYFGVSSIAI